MSFRHARTLAGFIASLLTATTLAQQPAGRPASDPDGQRQRERIRERVESRLEERAIVHRNIEYATPGPVGSEPVKLDLYVPKTGDGPFPLIVWVHGGGWESGDKNPCPALILMPEGFAIASVNYRLTDVAPFPAQIEDVKAAVRWLRAHAKENKLDPERFGAWGASAGGHLVALLGTSCGVKELEGAELGNAEQSSRVQAVCDWYGPTDFTKFPDAAGARTNSMIHKLFGGSVGEKRDLAVLASPVTHVTPDDPPFLIQQGDKDPLVPVAQSEALDDALKAKGVPVEIMIVPGAGHGVLGKEANQKVREFFVKNLASTNHDVPKLSVPSPRSAP